MKTTTSLIQRINEIYDKGYDMKMTAKILGCAKTTVQNYVKNSRPRSTRFELMEVEK